MQMNCDSLKKIPLFQQLYNYIKELFCSTTTLLLYQKITPKFANRQSIKPRINFLEVYRSMILIAR